MSEPRPRLKALEEIEQTCIPGLVEVLRTFGFVKNFKNQTAGLRCCPKGKLTSSANAPSRRVATYDYFGRKAPSAWGLYSSYDVFMDRGYRRSSHR